MELQDYENGYRDAVKRYGEVCSNSGNCNSCPIGSQLGVGVSCADFAKNEPDRFAALLKIDTGHTYYNEFTRRFPMQSMSIGEVATNVCRKVVFEGYFDCEGGDCVSCWKEQYTSDVTVNPNETNKDTLNMSYFDDEEIPSLFDDDVLSSGAGANSNNFSNYDILS